MDVFQDCVLPATVFQAKMQLDRAEEESENEKMDEKNSEKRYYPATFVLLCNLAFKPLDHLNQKIPLYLP